MKARTHRARIKERAKQPPKPRRISTGDAAGRMARALHSPNSVLSVSLPDSPENRKLLGALLMDSGEDET